MLAFTPISFQISYNIATLSVISPDVNYIASFSARISFNDYHITTNRAVLKQYPRQSGKVSIVDIDPPVIILAFFLHNLATIIGQSYKSIGIMCL